MNQKKFIIASICIICLLIVASPITENWKDDPKDDFPLSYYPMFTHIWGGSTFVTYFIGVDKNKNYYSIPHIYVIPGSSFNTVRKQIIKIVRNGQAKQLCNFAARELRKVTVEPYSKTIALGVITSRINIEEFMNKRFKFPKEYKIHAQCLVVVR